MKKRSLKIGGTTSRHTQTASLPKSWSTGWLTIKRPPTERQQLNWCRNYWITALSTMVSAVPAAKKLQVKFYCLLWNKGKSHSCSSTKYRTGRILSLPEREHLPWTVLLHKVPCVPRDVERLKRCGVMFPMSVQGDCAAAALPPEQPQLDPVPSLPTALTSLLPRAQFSSWKTHLKNQPAKNRSFFSRGLVLWPWPSHQLHKH